MVEAEHKRELKQLSLTRRGFLKNSALAVPLLATGCHSISKPAASASEFVTIRNGRFERRGKPYFYLGADFFQAPMLADPELPGGRERLGRELDLLHAAGVTNLRLLAGSEGSIKNGALRGVLRTDGKSVGLQSVTHIASGKRLDQSMGLFSHYRFHQRVRVDTE